MKKTYAPTIVPPSITGVIRDLCEKVSGHATPTYVDVLPTPDALRNKCALNARDEAVRRNGSVVLGWSIFSWPGAIIEFIGHAVVHADERTYCVTPAANGEKRILFLPDANMKFDFESADSRLPSRSFSVSRHKVVSRLIEVQQESVAIKEKYPVTGGEIVVEGADAEKLRILQEQEEVLFQNAIYLHHLIL